MEGECMTELLTSALLASDEPAPWSVENAEGISQCLIICDHAGWRIPRSLGSLGVLAADRQRHIAWDIGAAAVASELGRLLNACVILQTYSRLVIDCNRPLDSPGSIVTMSEDTAIPGNAALTAVARTQRQEEIFQPYHQRIRAELEARRRRGRPTWLIAMHTFTPVFRSNARSWHAGVLYNRDPRLARALLAVLREDASLVVGDNEPYSVSDTTDYAIPVYGEALRLPHVGIEVRQDLVATAIGQQQWSQRLASALHSVADQPDWMQRIEGAATS
jgi:predicted N-formylglutamate amidohydrolase